MAEEDKSTATGDELQTDEKVVKAEKSEKITEKKEKTYGEDYVHGLHEENARRRQNEKELATKLKSFEDAELAKEQDLQKKNKALEEKLNRYERESNDKLTAADRRFVLSEARRVAQALGMIDVDDVKAIDLADLRISDDDKVIGLDDSIADLKKRKPHWFKSETDGNKDEAKGDNKKDDKGDDKRRNLRTPPRRGENTDNSKDWSTADPKELRKHLASYGVNA